MRFSSSVPRAARLTGHRTRLSLLLALAAAPALAQTIVTGPAGSGSFGATVTVLPNGNYVVTDPGFDAGATLNVGAVYLYNGATNVRISTLTGTKADDQVGSDGITVLTNGNYVVKSPFCDNGPTANAGAATWCSATTGVNGAVSVTNSLMGTSVNDGVSNSGTGTDGVLALTNGNYVVGSIAWHNANTGGQAVGAATWCNGTTGRVGSVGVSNSLVGSTQDDQVARKMVALTNGNYVVSTLFWNNGAAARAGAATWGNGTTGTTGTVSAANSLVGSKTNDNVSTGGVTALPNGNYVVSSKFWDAGATTDVGAATWGSGTTGVSGAVSATNSLVGTSAFDAVSSGGLTALANGNYVVGSPEWRNGGTSRVGAATWGNGTTGLTGAVSAANSLLGSITSANGGGNSGNNLGNLVTALTNGNYVVVSGFDNGALNVGAVTWVSGAGPTSAVVSASNSLTGTTANDNIGKDDFGGSGITALANGHYVVSSPQWDNGATTDVGAATWCNGTLPASGTVSAANSLIGSHFSDRVSSNGATALTNGNYVVISPKWLPAFNAPGTGATTWRDGSAAAPGVVSSANSLVGSTANDNVGNGGVTALTNGNYVVDSYQWRNGGVSNAGAVTWGSGTSGVSGAVSATNSLVGTTAGDEVGNPEVIPFADGAYAVSTTHWHNGAIANAGAATPGNGASGTTGPVTACNSIAGSINSGGAGVVVAYRVATGTLIGGLPAENKVVVGSPAAPAAPTGAASQSFPTGATVADLVATGAGIQWYLFPDGPFTALDPSTLLTDGTTYYATQTVGSCESTGRLAVTVTLTAATPPNLIISTARTIPPGHYNRVIVDSAGVATMIGTVRVDSSFSVNPAGELRVGCDSIVGAGRFVLAARAALVVCNPDGLSLNPHAGAVQVRGTRSFSAGATYAYNGTAPQVTGNALPATVRKLAVTNPTTVTLSQAVAVTDVLHLRAGTLATNGKKLTLISTATRTASAIHAGGLTSGRVTVQRYVGGASGISYHHMGSPVGFDTVRDLNTAGFTVRVNPAYNTLPVTTISQAQAPNVYGYDERRGGTNPAFQSFGVGYYSPLGVDSLLRVGRGYAVAIPGGRTPDFVGALVTGNVPVTLTVTGTPTASNKAGWHLLSNPYAQTIDWDLLTTPAGLDASVYVWYSKGGNTGAYRTRNASGLGSLTDGLIGLGQGFFVRTAAPTIFPFTNGLRVDSIGLKLGRPAPEARPVLTLTLAQTGAPADEADALTVYAQPGATTGYDGAYDAVRPGPNAGLPTLSALIDGGEALISALPETVLTTPTTVELTATLPAVGQYTLAVDRLLNWGSASVELLDRLTDTRYNLRQQPTISLTATRANEAVTGRFAVVFNGQRPLGMSHPALGTSHLTLVPNPATGGSVRLTRPTGADASAPVLVLDAAGRLVRRAVVGADGALDVRGLPAGVYVVRAGAATARLVLQ